MSTIQDWRAKIDEVDAALIKLLNRRASYSLAIGEIKKTKNLPVYDPAREKEILARLEQLNEGPLGPLAVRRLFERIIDESRHLEKERAQIPESQSDSTE